MPWTMATQRRPHSWFGSRRGLPNPAPFFFAPCYSSMKLLVEILLAIFLHPIAWVLCVINIVGRTDMGGEEGPLDHHHIRLGHRSHPLHPPGRRLILVAQ